MKLYETFRPALLPLSMYSIPYTQIFCIETYTKILMFSFYFRNFFIRIIFPFLFF